MTKAAKCTPRTDPESTGGRRGRRQAPSFARQRLTRVLTQPHSKQLVDPRLTGTRSQGRWGLRDSPAGDLGDVRLNER